MYVNFVAHTLPDVFAIYQSQTGAVQDEVTGLLTVTPAQFAALPSMFYEINGVRIDTSRYCAWPMR